MHPIKQFDIHTLVPIKLLGYDISITSSTVAMGMVCILCVGLPYLALRQNSGKSQALLELSFDLVTDTMKQYAHQLDYFPFIFSVFLFVLMANLIGVIPGIPTATSHIIVTFVMACIVYGSVIILGIAKKGWGFFRVFLPTTVPVYLAPLFIPIELVSFLSKPFSMAIRLFANMVAGHIVLKIFAGFVISLLGFSWLLKPLAFIPLAVNALMTLFEIAVAFIQAYVFTILSCIYIDEMLGESH